MWLLLNKIDRVDAFGRTALTERYPGAHQLSAKDRSDVSALRDLLIEKFAGKLEEADLVVPWALQRLVHRIHESATVLAEEHDEQGTTLRVRAPARTLDNLRAALDQNRSA
jgi:GTP-binding protein HflX